VPGKYYDYFALGQGLTATYSEGDNKITKDVAGFAISAD